MQLATVQAHITKTLDWWYGEQAPFLTAERRREIAELWSSRSALRAADHHTKTPSYSPGRLSVEESYTVLFSARERTEISLDEFRGELRDFLASGASKHSGEAQAGLSLEEALDFLRAVQ